jgi:hypothetical protein
MSKSRFTDEEGTAAPVVPLKPRRIDHWDDQGAGSRDGDGGSPSPTCFQPGYVLAGC